MDQYSVYSLFGLVAAQLAIYGFAWAACAWHMPEERSVASHAAAFSMLVALGMLLASLRNEEQTWIAYAGPNISFALGFICLRRSGEKFLRHKPRDFEHMLIAVFGCGALAILGLQSDTAWIRVVLAYGLISFILLRMLIDQAGPMRAEFGLRFSATITITGLLVAAAFGLRATQQWLSPGSLLEIHQSNLRNVEMLFGYVIGAALFNFAFLAMLVRRLLNQLRMQSLQDQLTGLPNRRAFDGVLAREWQRFRRHRTPCVLLALDLDYFKKINDTYGHDGGDLVLIKTAQVLREFARQTDFVARMGGEEFVILMTDLPSDQGPLAAERIRAAIAAQRFDEPAMAVTVSIGVACAMVDDSDSAALLRRADLALYRAKDLGRNQVCVAAEIATVRSSNESELAHLL